MRLRSRFLSILTIGSILLVPALSLAQGAQQPPQTPAQMLEPLVKRLTNDLNLSEEQVAQLRQLLAAHEAKFMELRRRAQVNPFAPALEADQNTEQKAIKDEMGAFLTDE